MVRKIFSLHLFAAVVCIAANGFVNADCGTCVSGNCGGNLLGKLHQAPCGGGGPCMTCNNLWDDYCATKTHCLPQAKYPFQNKGCGGGACGGCSSCNAGVGVGLYGKCATGNCGVGSCSGAVCDAPCASGKCSGAGLLGKLFKPKHHVGCSEVGCSSCASGASAPVYSQSAPAYGQPAATHTQQAPVYSQPVPSQSTPVQAAPVINSAPVPVAPASPSDVPAALPSADVTPRPPMPPAPRVTKRGDANTGGFSWLQQALRSN